MKTGRIHNRQPSPVPRDLREVSSHEPRTYPVDTAAVERFKRKLAEQAAAESETPKRKTEIVYDFSMNPERKASAAASRWGNEEQAMTKEEVDDVQAAYPPVVPVELYPQSAIAAAKEQLKKGRMARRLFGVFTPEVCAVFWKWRREGRPLEWIAEHNGLVPTTISTLERYMRMHRSEESPSPAPPADPFAGIEPREDTTASRNSTGYKNGTAKAAVTEIADQIDDPKLRSLVRLMQAGDAELSGTVTFDLSVKINL